MTKPTGPKGTRKRPNGASPLAKKIQAEAADQAAAALVPRRLTQAESGAGEKLSAKEERFCQEYLLDSNASAAALRAGYAMPHSGRDLLIRARVDLRVNELKAEQAAFTRVTAGYVVTNLAEILERCMQRAPVMERGPEGPQHKLDDLGREVWQFDAKGATAALKLLGDTLGLYTKNVRVGNVDGETLKLEAVAAISDEERAKRTLALLERAKARANAEDGK